MTVKGCLMIVKSRLSTLRHWIKKRGPVAPVFDSSVVEGGHVVLDGNITVEIRGTLTIKTIGGDMVLSATGLVGNRPALLLEQPVFVGDKPVVLLPAYADGPCLVFDPDWGPSGPCLPPGFYANAPVLTIKENDCVF